MYQKSQQKVAYAGGQSTSIPNSIGGSEDFKRAMWLSLGFHLLLIVIIGVRITLFPPEPMRIATAVRVDIVALPDKNPKLPDVEKPTQEAKPLEQPAPAPIPQPAKPVLPDKAQPKPVPAPVANTEKSIKAEQSAAIKRIEALKKIQQMADREKNKQIATAVNAAIKGNQLSKGNSLSGVIKLDHEQYLDQVNARVKKHWSLPRWLENANLQVQIMVYIDANGKLLKKTMTKSSGNPTFDAKALEAIDRAFPMPKPPGNLTSLLQTDGIEMGFPD